MGREIKILHRILTDGKVSHYLVKSLRTDENAIITKEKLIEQVKQQKVLTKKLNNFGNIQTEFDLDLDSSDLINDLNPSKKVELTMMLGMIKQHVRENGEDEGYRQLKKAMDFTFNSLVNVAELVVCDINKKDIESIRNSNKLLLIVTGCTKKEDKLNTELSIVCNTAVMYDVARNLKNLGYEVELVSEGIKTGVSTLKVKFAYNRLQELKLKKEMLCSENIKVSRIPEDKAKNNINKLLDSLCEMYGISKEKVDLKYREELESELAHIDYMYRKLESI